MGEQRINCVPFITIKVFYQIKMIDITLNTVSKLSFYKILLTSSHLSIMDIRINIMNMQTITKCVLDLRYTAPRLCGWIIPRLHILVGGCYFWQGWFVWNSRHYVVLRPEPPCSTFDKVLTNERRRCTCNLPCHWRRWSHNNDVTWASWRLRSQASWQFIQQLVQIKRAPVAWWLGTRVLTRG